MTNFYVQHVGEALAQRDFPRSIGEKPRNYRVFRRREMESWHELQTSESSMELQSIDEPEAGWQIWGLPSGADQATSGMGKGDILMLKSAESECDYVGRIAWRFQHYLPDVSRRIWADSKFSIIVLLTDSGFLDLTWEAFCDRLDYRPNYTLRGKTTRVSPVKIKASGFRSADDLFRWVKGFSK